VVSWLADGNQIMGVNSITLLSTHDLPTTPVVSS